MSPCAPTDVGVGAIVTAAGGPASTTTCAAVLRPLEAAVTTYDPVVRAVTRPVADTVSPFGSLLVQVTGRPTNTVCAASRTVAVSWYVPPVI